MPYKTHLFICTNSPDRSDKCGSKNSEKLRKVVKEHCAENFDPAEVRVNSSGCLGHCERGIVAVVYPQNQWLFDLTENDSEKLVQAVTDHQKNSSDEE